MSNGGHEGLSPNLDASAIAERYRLERDRRATSGSRRYQGMGGEGRPLGDPYTAPAERSPVFDTMDALIIGGGFGGLLTAARLREAGVADVRIVEAAGDFGGTWYWNRYPGAACDIESYIYFPLLEETGYMPVERYSKAAEIRTHCRRIAERYKLYDGALLSTRVQTLKWRGEDGVWDVRTDRGDRLGARFIVLATGPLNRPKLPTVPGLDTFKGHSFHTSRWDYDYTGGSATELLVGLADKRVGIIGTGATAVQCVPPLAASAKHLYVFQRTPSSVDARDNSPTDPAWAGSLQPGWQQARMENFTAQMAGHFAEDDIVRDGWTVLARAVRAELVRDPDMSKFTAHLAKADMVKMVGIRERIDRIVADKDTAEALKPWFSLFCKRPCFHDDYLATFNRPNVTLVDTQGRGLEAINEIGVVVDGGQIDLDCLIFATGFETASDFAKRSGFEMSGVNGLSLTQKWSSGMASLHGMHSRGFPNCFFITQAQSGMSPNFPHMLSEQAKHIAHIVEHCKATDIRTVESSAEAEQAWVDIIVRTGESRLRFLETCTPGYYNNEGCVSSALLQSFPYGNGPVAFIELLRKWRNKGDFAGLEFDGVKVGSGKISSDLADAEAIAADVVAASVKA